MARRGLAALDENSVEDVSVIFVMNHRSNIDYVLLAHLMAHRAALSYAAGEWAYVWPLERLIGGMGAYFVRRRWDYFVKNLLGAEPPKEYQIGRPPIVP